MLFNDSADKAARFIWLCDAFEIPLLFLADVPGFMIGTDVERRGIIRHGAKMISAVSEATVPKISVIVRKAYGAGLYAMAGPAYDSDAVIALPSAQIAVMGPEPAVNAVFFNKLAELPEEERETFDLLWYQGLTQAEAGALLGLSERTVKRRWQSARLLLHDRLKGQLPDLD